LRSRRFASATGRFASFALGLCAAFALAELGVRLAGHSTWTAQPGLGDTLLHEPDPELGWRNAPGAHTWNTRGPSIRMTFWSDGLRATSGQRRAGRRQAVVIGGSFTQGWAVSDADTYAWRLSEAVPAAEWLNYGTGGYGTYQSLLALRRHLARADARTALVIYGFIDHHEGRNVANPAWLRGLARSAEQFTVRLPYVTLDPKGGLQEHPPTGYPDWPAKRRSALVALLEERLHAVRTSGRKTQARGATQALLRELRREARAHGARLLVVVLSQSPPRTRESYRQFFEREGFGAIECWHPEQNEMLVPGYGHPSARANHHWAECIENAIRRRGLLSWEP